MDGEAEAFMERQVEHFAAIFADDADQEISRESTPRARINRSGGAHLQTLRSKRLDKRVMEAGIGSKFKFGLVFE